MKPFMGCHSAWASRALVRDANSHPLHGQLAFLNGGHFLHLKGMSGPIVLQVHTRDWLRRCSGETGLCSLGEVPEGELDLFVAAGFDFVYLLGVWQTGPAGAKISQTNKAWRAGFLEALPDLQEEDICGSIFAIVGYTVHRDFGGAAALELLRRRLRERHIGLMLDFVPNHTAIDHPWVSEHPDYYVGGTAADLAGNPENYLQLGDRIFAHGRDPYFPGWGDTLQLNYGHADLQAAMLGELESVAKQCDAVRCDMAMLILPEIFQRTWGIVAGPFWENAIKAVRGFAPDFLFVAEVYWNLGTRLQQIGFDYTYDKTLYDLLVEQNAGGVKARLSANSESLAKSVHFFENHDEPRAAAVFPPAVYKPAALATFCLPGMRLFHDGQLEGYRRKPSIHLARRAMETPDNGLVSFYAKLFEVLRSASEWLVLSTMEAWGGNPTFQDILCSGGRSGEGMDWLAAINYSGHGSQCYVRFPADSFETGEVILSNIFGEEKYKRDGDELRTRGLYLDLEPWAYQVFRVS